MSHEGPPKGERAYFSHLFKHESGVSLAVYASLEKRVGKRPLCWVEVNDGTQFVGLTGHVAVYFANALTQIAEINPTITSPVIHTMSGEIAVMLLPDYEDEARAVILVPRSSGFSQAFIISSKAQFHGCIDRIIDLSVPERKSYHSEAANSCLPVNSSMPEKMVTGPVADLLCSAHEHSEYNQLKDRGPSTVQ